MTQQVTFFKVKSENPNAPAFNAYMKVGENNTRIGTVWFEKKKDGTAIGDWAKQLTLNKEAEGGEYPAPRVRFVKDGEEFQYIKYRNRKEDKNAYMMVEKPDASGNWDNKETLFFANPDDSEVKETQDGDKFLVMTLSKDVTVTLENLGEVATSQEATAEKDFNEMEGKDDAIKYPEEDINPEDIPF